MSLAPGRVHDAAPLSARDIAVTLGLPAPTPEQRAVIEASLDPLLIVAGAGSGKTETMAARVVWLVACGLVAPDRVLGLTFTRKAAGELADRVRLRLGGLAAAGLLPAAAHDDAFGGGVDGGLGGGVGGGLDDGEGVSVSTYHAYAAALLADHGMRAGLEPGTRLITDAAAWQIASDVVASWDDLGDLDAAPSTVTDAVLGLAAECAEHLVDPRDVAGFLDAALARARALPGRPRRPLQTTLGVLDDRRRLVPLVQAYARRKADLGVLDHGDQVALAARLAADDPTVATVERARWAVVLLDEFQDTSSAQARLLQALFGQAHPVTAVGDPHQSIYGWRGASAGGLGAFPAAFPRADGAPARAVTLSTSWRNDLAVLAAAGAVAAPLRAGSTLDTPDLGPRPGAQAGRVDVRWHVTTGEEADALAETFLAARRSQPGASMAVLCRARRQIPVIEQALRARGLPVEVVGLGGLLDRPCVQDVVAALQAVADPTRGEAVLRLLTGPRWRIGPRDLAALGSWSRRGTGPRGSEEEAASLADALDELPPADWVAADGRSLSATARHRLGEVAAVLRRLRAVAHLPLPDVVAEAERALGLDVELAAVPGTAPADARADLDAFTDVAATYAADAADAARGSGPLGPVRAGITAFLAWLEAARLRERGLEAEDLPAGPGMGAPDAGGDIEVHPGVVQVMTVHAAKGLEWDVVAVPGLVEGAFPNPGRRRGGWLSGLAALPYPLRGDAPSLPALAWDDAADAAALETAIAAFTSDCADHAVAEERRLAYVAITRARSRLLLSGAWWFPGTQQHREPSRFLRDVLAALAAAGHAVPTLPAAPEHSTNPSADTGRRAVWPADPLAGRREDVEAAAKAVRQAWRATSREPAAPAEPAASATATPWDEEIDRLLAERDAPRSSSRVVLPASLSASRLVELAADPAAFAASVRRPMPVRPHEATRRGVAFHAWLEERFRAPTLLDLDDPDDDGPDDDRDDADDGWAPVPATPLATLRANFLASPWADRTPSAVEVALETPVAGLVVRCRIDAVFPSADGGVQIVDWKTGARPTGSRARSAAVQLAVYRLAWARHSGLPLAAVRAAFFYAADGVTHGPVDLLDERGLTALVTALPERP